MRSGDISDSSRFSTGLFFPADDAGQRFDITLLARQYIEHKHYACFIITLFLYAEKKGHRCWRHAAMHKMVS